MPKTPLFLVVAAPKTPFFGAVPAPKTPLFGLCPHLRPPFFGVPGHTPTNIYPEYPPRGTALITFDGTSHRNSQNEKKEVVLYFFQSCIYICTCMSIEVNVSKMHIHVDSIYVKYMFIYLLFPDTNYYGRSKRISPNLSVAGVQTGGCLWRRRFSGDLSDLPTCTQM